MLLASMVGGDSLLQANLNQVASQFGFTFNSDRVNAKQHDLFAEHPIASGVSYIASYEGGRESSACSISVSPPASSIVLIDSQTTLQEYRNGLLGCTEAEFGLIQAADGTGAIAVASTSGAGRVVGFCDAFILANGNMATQGFGDTSQNRRFAVNLFNWLTGRE